MSYLSENCKFSILRSSEDIKGFSCGDTPHQKSLKDYPAVLIGRLGVSEKYKGLHIGSDTIEFIKYWFIDPFNKTGCRFVIVDAYNNPQTKSFYINNGFRVVFSSEEQEKEYRHLKEAMVLKTRLMYFDLFSLTKL